MLAFILLLTVINVSYFAHAQNVIFGDKSCTYSVAGTQYCPYGGLGALIPVKLNAPPAKDPFVVRLYSDSFNQQQCQLVFTKNTFNVPQYVKFNFNETSKSKSPSIQYKTLCGKPLKAMMLRKKFGTVKSFCSLNVDLLQDFDTKNIYHLSQELKQWSTISFYLFNSFDLSVQVQFGKCGAKLCVQTVAVGYSQGFMTYYFVNGVTKIARNNTVSNFNFVQKDTLFTMTFPHAEVQLIKQYTIIGNTNVPYFKVNIRASKDYYGYAANGLCGNIATDVGENSRELVRSQYLVPAAKNIFSCTKINRCPPPVLGNDVSCQRLFLSVDKTCPKT